MTRLLSRTLAFSAFLVPLPAIAQEPTTSPPGAGEETSIGETAESPPDDDLDARRRRALVDYGVGNVDAAHAQLEELVKECDAAENSSCPDPLRAKLYVALAIVLAGGKDDEKGAARLFHAALTRDPDVTVPREFATRPVQAAMREANESTSYEELNQPRTEKVPREVAPEEKANSAPEPTPEPERTPPSDNKTGVLLIHALAGAGGDDYGDGGSLGAAAVLGARFVDSSAWTTAIRGRAAIVGHSEEAVGGVSLLMGGSWFNPKNRRMGYFLGGLGLDSYGGEGGISLNGMGGVSLGGFLIGGGVDFGSSGFGSFGMMTLHLGWGARL